jgi:NADH dehydrogenase (ubiquinone) Fe-S protein 3|tara:strand:+ start:408 stop:944 length:537 start_codon:yes stop_codon:yes gene_type:complete
MNNVHINFAESLAKMLPHSIYKIVYSDTTNDISVIVPHSCIYEVILFLRDHQTTQFKILSDITAVDFPDRENRFEVVYNLLSLRYNIRITVKTVVNEITSLDSIVALHNSANWYEREVWDLFGIFFTNHPDLRRILTDYGFEGHPLRKDFPLSGFTEVRYDITSQRVITEPLELSQEF